MMADKLYVFFYFMLSSTSVVLSLYACLTKAHNFWVFYGVLFFCAGCFFCFLAVSRIMDILDFLCVSTLEQLRKEQPNE